MTTLEPYLSFDGNCEAAFNFYRSVFGGEFAFVGRYKEMPPTEQNVPEAWKEKLMHIVYPINEHFTLMGADSKIIFGHRPTVGDNISLSLHCNTVKEAERIFEALSSGGKIIMSLEKVFWAELFGMFTDKYGISWMITYGEPST